MEPNKINYSKVKQSNITLGAKADIPMEPHTKPEPKSTGGKKIVYGTEKKMPAHRWGK
jgi:hypothetical protein